ncbi:MAG: serine protease [Acidobacteria bacterium]|nr:serine protease [Acidobacteriota bacterium]
MRASVMAITAALLVLPGAFDAALASAARPTADVVDSGATRAGTDGAAASPLVVLRLSWTRAGSEVVRFQTAWTIDERGYLLTSTAAWAAGGVHCPGSVVPPNTSFVRLRAELWRGGNVTSIPASLVLADGETGLALLKVHGPLPRAFRLAAISPTAGTARMVRLWMPPGGLGINADSLSGARPRIQSQGLPHGTLGSSSELLVDAPAGLDQRWAGAPVLDDRTEVVGMANPWPCVDGGRVAVVPLDELRGFLTRARFQIRVEPPAITPRLSQVHLTLSPVLASLDGCRATAALTGSSPVELERVGHDLVAEVPVPGSPAESSARTLALAVTVLDGAGAELAQRTVEVPVAAIDWRQDGAREVHDASVVDAGQTAHPPASDLSRMASGIELRPEALRPELRSPRKEEGNSGVVTGKPADYSHLENELARRWATEWDRLTARLQAVDAGLVGSSGAGTGDGTARGHDLNWFWAERRRLLLQVDRAGVVLQALNICRCDDQVWYTVGHAPCRDCRLILP